MATHIPNNIILKSIYKQTLNQLNPHYIQLIKNKIIDYIKNNENYCDNLEIESKFGIFKFLGIEVRQLSKIEETFLIPEDIPKHSDTKYQFNAGLRPDKFYLIWDAVEKESKIKNSKIEFLGTFTIKDIMYKSNKRESIFLENGKEIKRETITKEDKKNINVRNFGNDFRITCSKEMPTDVIDKEEKDSIREKF